mgnify:CR=1 FL=1
MGEKKRELHNMTNSIEAGQVLKGTVTGVQPYGAFVKLNDDNQGLVHISEITHGYVKDIKDHLAVGDEVNVKVLNIDESNGKISLSIRATEVKPGSNKQKQVEQTNQDTQGFNVLKDKLEEWIEQTSEREKIYRK